MATASRWVGWQGISATHTRFKLQKKHRNVLYKCVVQNQFMLLSCYFDLFTMSRFISFWFWLSRVHRNKWANFVGCSIDQTFWPEARVHVVSFGDQDTEARFSSFSVSPSLTRSRGVLRCWKWRFFIEKKTAWKCPDVMTFYWGYCLTRSLTGDPPAAVGHVEK